MFHTCLPATARPATLHAPATAARRGKRHFTIDIHAHLVSAEAEALTKPHFKPENETFLVFSNDATREVNRKQETRIHDQVRLPEPRLADMDARGIDVQVISPSPHQYFYWAEPELGRQAARLCNDRIAEVVARHPDRFAGLGTVPLQAPEMAVAELERCVRELGFRGVEIGTNIRGGELSDPALRPFWAKAQELGVLVFMHPAGTTEGRRLAEHYFVNLIGNPLESTLAVSHLIFGGVLDAYPRLKICVAHGGGYLASYPGRFDHAHAARPDCRLLIKKRPSTYLKKLYFDTLVFTPEQLEHLVRLYGSDHVLLGTDYPFDMGDEDPVGFIASATRLNAADRAAIMGLNAARLLKIRIPAAKKPAPKPAATKPAAKTVARSAGTTTGRRPARGR